MTLTSAITRLVIDKGAADIDDLCPLLPGYTRRQVLDGMKNARKLGLIHCPAKPTSRGRGLGRAPAPCYPGPKSLPLEAEKPHASPLPACPIVIRPPASAWELAHCRQIPGQWPPPWEGGRVYAMQDEEEVSA